MTKATFVKRFPVGRSVRVRFGYDWISGTVTECNGTSVVVATRGYGHHTNIHYSVAHRDLRDLRVVR